MGQGSLSPRLSSDSSVKSGESSYSGLRMPVCESPGKCGVRRAREVVALALMRADFSGLVFSRAGEGFVEAERVLHGDGEDADATLEQPG